MGNVHKGTEQNKEDFGYSCGDNGELGVHRVVLYGKEYERSDQNADSDKEEWRVEGPKKGGRTGRRTRRGDRKQEAANGKRERQ